METIIKTRDPRKIGLLYGLAESKDELSVSVDNLKKSLDEFEDKSEEQYQKTKDRFDELLKVVNETKTSINEQFKSLKEERESSVKHLKEILLNILPFDLTPEQNTRMFDIIDKEVGKLSKMSDSINNAFGNLEKVAQALQAAKLEESIKTIFEKFMEDMQKLISNEINDLYLGYADGEAIAKNLRKK